MAGGGGREREAGCEKYLEASGGKNGEREREKGKNRKKGKGKKMKNRRNEIKGK